MTPEALHNVLNDFRSEVNGSIAGFRRELTDFINDRRDKLEEQNTKLAGQDVVLGKILTNTENTNGKVAENVRAIELQRIESARINAALEAAKWKAASDRRVVYVLWSALVGLVLLMWALFPDQIRAILTPASKEERVRVVDDRIREWFPTQPSPKPPH